MTKGTTSMGKYTRKKVHIRCRRCGHNSFHKRGKTCSKCGYPDPKMRKYNWIKRRVKENSYSLLTCKKKFCFSTLASTLALDFVVVFGSVFLGAVCAIIVNRFSKTRKENK